MASLTTTFAGGGSPRSGEKCLPPKQNSGYGVQTNLGDEKSGDRDDDHPQLQRADDGVLVVVVDAEWSWVVLVPDDHTGDHTAQ